MNSLENAYTYTYRNDDGTLTSEIHIQPVQYKDAGGTWRDIDAELVPDSGGGWTNAADSVDSHVASTSDSGTLLSLSHGGEDLKLSSGDDAANHSGGVTGDTVTYSNVYGGVDERIQSIPHGLEQTLSIPSPNVPSEFDFALSAPGFPLSERGPARRRAASARAVGSLRRWHSRWPWNSGPVAGSRRLWVRDPGSSPASAP